MNSTRVGKFLAVATAVGLGLGGFGAAIAADPPTYKQFKADTYVDFDGSYVVNGDESLTNDGDLRKFYESMVSSTGQPLEDELVVNTVNGVDDKWSAGQVANLTYCVSNRFKADKAGIVAAMAAGAALWEGASSSINFVYDSTQDGSCNTRNPNVVFSVEPVSSNQYIAKAFFPHYPKRYRKVVVDNSIWSAGNWEPGDILGHELGHVLGFRHEHTRPEAGTCFEDSNWRELTPYDKASIMHYPQCNGTADDLEFQQSDADGAVALYGP